MDPFRSCRATIIVNKIDFCKVVQFFASPPECLQPIDPLGPGLVLRFQAARVTWRKEAALPNLIYYPLSGRLKKIENRGMMPMDKKDFFDRITSDPDILHGKPCIKGTRIPVYLVVSLIAEGETIENIIKDYPSLTPEDIRAAIHYAAKLSEYEAYAL